MLEKYLIEHCSPTLASLKTANLFRCFFSNQKEIEKNLTVWNFRLSGKGVSLFSLKTDRNSALIYVYRRKKLNDDLKNPEISRFLRSYGYTETTVGGALFKLKNRVETSPTFPHEIGVFLGYPLGDVIGFIQNSGKNCIACGCWKVYCNERETIKLFTKFKKCKDIYTHLWKQGKSVLQLTVAV